MSTIYAHLLDVIEHQVQAIYEPIIDDDIDFLVPKTMIKDFNDSQCQLEFQFRKSDLQRTADFLWPYIEPYLDGTCDNLLLENRYRAPYEIC